jgi:hypothetical protein
MARLHVSDPKSVVHSMMVDYVLRQFASGYYNSTAAVIASTLAGARVRDRYRFDITDPERATLAKQYLRGLIADCGV